MDYGEIADKLRLDREGDMKAARLLDSLITGKKLSRFGFIKNRCVIVCGAGPSLKKDLRELKKEKLHEACVFIAADGAAKALLEEKITPDVVVTDLDGDLEALREAERRGSVMVVHAHADNIESIERIVPRLGEVFGTTQTREFGKLHNFGGFTDGDRAAYLAERSGAKVIALAGMDFGEEIGAYSGSKNQRFTLEKLQVGKKLIEELAQKTNAGLYNLTSGGEKLENVPRIAAKHLRETIDPMP